MTTNPLEKTNVSPYSPEGYAYQLSLDALRDCNAHETVFDHAVTEVARWNIQTGHMNPDPVKAAEEFWSDPQPNRVKRSIAVAKQNLAVDLIQEEVDELREAVQRNDRVETLDAIADILFTVFGLAAKAGLTHKVDPAFWEVVASNDTKIPTKGEDRTILPGGKIGKPAGYRPPNLDQIVDHQFSNPEYGFEDYRAIVFGRYPED